MSPFTGRGFTGAKEIILPEYMLTKSHFFDTGDVLRIYNRNGDIIQSYRFIKDYGWKVIK